MAEDLHVCISNRGRGQSTISDTFPGMWESIAVLTKTTFKPVWTTEYGNYDSYWKEWTPHSTMQKLVSGECNISEPLLPLSLRLKAVDCISHFYSWLVYAVVINKELVSYEPDFKWFNVLKYYEWTCLIAAGFCCICFGKGYKSAVIMTMLASVAVGLWSVVYGNNILFSLFIRPHLPFDTLLEAVENARDGKLKLAMAMSDTTSTLFQNMETRRTAFFGKLKDVLDETTVYTESTEEKVFRRVAKYSSTITGSFFGHSLRVAKRLFKHSKLTSIKVPEFTEVMTPLIHKNFTLRHRVNQAFVVLAEHGLGIRYSREVDQIQKALQWSEGVDQKPLRLDMMKTMFLAFAIASLVCCASEVYFSGGRMLCNEHIASDDVHANDGKESFAR